MTTQKSIGFQEYGYILRFVGDEHEVWESQGGRFSVYSMSPYRAVKSNIRSLEDAVTFLEQLEGRISAEELEPSISPMTGRVRRGAAGQIRSVEELGLGPTGGFPETREWLEERIERGEVLRPTEPSRVREIGEEAYGGYKVLYSTPDYTVWRSPRGRFSFEKHVPVRSVRSGISEAELQRMISEMGGGVPYQMPLPEEPLPA